MPGGLRPAFQAHPGHPVRAGGIGGFGPVHPPLLRGGGAALLGSLRVGRDDGRAQPIVQLPRCLGDSGGQDPGFHPAPPFGIAEDPGAVTDELRLVRVNQPGLQRSQGGREDVHELACDPDPAGGV